MHQLGRQLVSQLVENFIKYIYFRSFIADFYVNLLRGPPLTFVVPTNNEPLLWFMIYTYLLKYCKLFLSLLNSIL